MLESYSYGAEVSQETEKKEKRPEWDFPVERKELYFMDHQDRAVKVPNKYGVVRTDTNKTLAVVGPAYKIVEHQAVLDKFEPFIKIFGEPKRTVNLTNNGSRMMAIYDFKTTKQVAKDDFIGFRLFATSGYDAKTAVKLSVAGLRLKCLNGMVSSEKALTLSYAHNNNSILDMEFPSHDTVMAIFERDIARWSKYTEAPIARPENRANFVDQVLAIPGLIPDSRTDDFIQDSYKFRTAWDAYNYLTYDITHKSGANQFTKMKRLSKVNELVDGLL